MTDPLLLLALAALPAETRALRRVLAWMRQGRRPESVFHAWIATRPKGDPQ
jgi:hypothetical protein